MKVTPQRKAFTYIEVSISGTFSNLNVNVFLVTTSEGGGFEPMFSFMGESGNRIELQGSWYLNANVGIDTKLQTNGQKVI